MVRELINVEAVDRAFGAVYVLRDINLKVNDGDRIRLPIMIVSCKHLTPCT